MKTLELPIMSDASIAEGQAELTTFIDGQTTPFVINGNEELLTEMAGKLYRKDETARRRLARKVVDVVAPVEQVISPVTQYVEAVKGNIKTDVGNVIFDIINGTKSYDDYQRDKKINRVARHYAKLGLTDFEPCAKHRKAMESISRMI